MPINLNKNVLKIKDSDTNEWTGLSNLVTQQIDSTLSETSTNPIQNATVTKKLNQLSQEIVNQQSQINDLPNNETLIENVVEKVPIVKVAESPTFVDSIAEMTDTSKMYVLNSDGMFYSYKTKTVATEGSTVPNFTNIYNTENGAYIKDGYRYSNSSSAFKEQSGNCAIVVPINLGVGVAFTLKVRGATTDGASYAHSNYIYTGETNDTFTTPLAGTHSMTESDGEITISGTTLASGTHDYIVFNVASGVDESELIVALNEEITYTTTEGGTETITEWTSTGIAYNQPADYENRVIANENNIEELQTKTAVLEKRLDGLKYSGVTDTTVFTTPAYCPNPQLPVDGSDSSDFDASSMTTQQAYDYMDALIAKRPYYITKQTLGKDTSGNFDYNRYFLCKAHWKAWYKQDYPRMFAWVNDNTTIYSESVSPRVGDTMYSTPYIGTAYDTVTAVNSIARDEVGADSTASTRTVNGLIFTRDTTKDVEPTLVYTPPHQNWGTNVYTPEFAYKTIAKADYGTYDDEMITTREGEIYHRYPFDDRMLDTSKPISVFILANEHGYTGDPRIPSIAVMRMAKDLCLNTENQFLKWLKENVNICIIPVGNPWGYDRTEEGDGYYNANGININRNYDTPGWSGSDTDVGGGVETFGAYAGSEIETQYIMNTVQNCKANVGISMHGNGATPVANEHLNMVVQGCGYDSDRVNKIGDALYCEYGYVFLSADNDETEDYNHAGKSASYMEYACDVGGMFESYEYEPVTMALHTSNVMEYAYTQLLLFLQTWIDEAILKNQ